MKRLFLAFIFVLFLSAIYSFRNPILISPVLCAGECSSCSTSTNAGCPPGNRCVGHTSCNECCPIAGSGTTGGTSGGSSGGCTPSRTCSYYGSSACGYYSNGCTSGALYCSAGCVSCNNSTPYGCYNGSATLRSETSGGYTWHCVGNGNEVSGCNYTKTPTCDNSTINGCVNGSACSTSSDSQYYYWHCCNSYNGLETSGCRAPKPVTCGGYCSSDSNWQGCWVNTWESYSACADTWNATHSCNDSRCTPASSCRNGGQSCTGSGQGDCCSGLVCNAGSCQVPVTNTPVTITSAPPPGSCSGGVSGDSCSTNSDCCSCRCLPPFGGGGLFCDGSNTSSRWPTCINPTTPPPTCSVSTSCNSCSVTCGTGTRSCTDVRSNCSTSTYTQSCTNNCGVLGYVYNDAGRNGVWDGTDALISSPVGIVRVPGIGTDTTSSGTYNIIINALGDHSVSIDTPLNGYDLETAASANFTISSANRWEIVDFGFLPTRTISGRFFVDTDGNGAKAASEPWYANTDASVSLTTGGTQVCSANTNSSGIYSCAGVSNFLDYTLTANAPSGYRVTSTNPRSYTNLVANQVNQNFGLESGFYNVTGFVWVDTHNFGVKDADEQCHNGTVRISIAGAAGQDFASTPACNTYSFSTSVDPHTVAIVSLPAGYSASGWFGSDSTGAKSGTGNITGNLTGDTVANFGMRIAGPWIQTKSGDLRIDSSGGINNSVPAGAICQPYASVVGTGGTPGIVFSGNSSANFAPGSVSSLGWLAGGASYPEIYSGTLAKKTSYTYLISKVQQSGISVIDLACDLNACDLAALSLSHGVYIARGDLTLTGADYTFPANQNFIILVNGDLTIAQKINIPTTSTAIFSSSGDIIVDKSIGETYNVETPTISGMYSADFSFIADGYGDCAVQPDTRLNISGNVITNAAGLGGSFQNRRDLCSNNSDCPAVFVSDRPDFTLNAPEFLRNARFIWQEIAP